MPSSVQLLWILDIYGFLVAGLLITMGTLGDRIGRRKLLLAGAAGFAVASVAAALSTSAEMLIASRAVMGVAGATIAPSTLSLIFTMFLDPKQRTTAIAVWIAAYSAGGAIGPGRGGILLGVVWWGSVFLIGVPVRAQLRRRWTLRTVVAVRESRFLIRWASSSTNRSNCGRSSSGMASKSRTKVS